MTRLRHLRVRIKELASEASHIRHEERQCSGEEKWELQDHRKTSVRRAARRAQLAYACLRGKPYWEVEQYVHDQMEAIYALKDSKKIALRFGGNSEDVDRWVKAAREYITTTSVDNTLAA